MKFRKINPKKELVEKAPVRENYPLFSLSLDTLPEAKKWDIGKTYRIALEIKMSGLDIDEDYGSARFTIRKIAVLPPPKQTKVKRYSN